MEAAVLAVLDSWRQLPPRRPDSELPFDLDQARAGPATLLLDTTVYVDELQRRLPARMERLLVDALVLHSAVARAELVLSAGYLDPRDPRTAQRRDAVLSAVAGIPLDAVVTPEDATWRCAAVVSGALARLQHAPDWRRRELLNDALLFFSAKQVGATLVSRNIGDMDRLLRVDSDVSVLLYRTEP